MCLIVIRCILSKFLICMYTATISFTCLEAPHNFSWLTRPTDSSWCYATALLQRALSLANSISITYPAFKKSTQVVSGLVYKYLSESSMCWCILQNSLSFKRDSSGYHSLICNWSFLNLFSIWPAKSQMGLSFSYTSWWNWQTSVSSWAVSIYHSASWSMMWSKGESRPTYSTYLHLTMKWPVPT